MAATTWAAWAILLATIGPADGRPVLVRDHYSEQILSLASLPVAFAAGYRQQTTASLLGLATFNFPASPARAAGALPDIVVNLMASYTGVALVATAQRAHRILTGLTAET
jgi:hypothetical protein